MSTLVLRASESPIDSLTSISIATALATVTELEANLELELNKLPLKRRSIRRNVELNGCFCGVVLDSSATGVIECKRSGCETQWVCIKFTGLKTIFLTDIFS